MFTDGKINIVEIQQYFPNILQIFTWKCEGSRIAKTVLKIMEQNCKTYIESPGISYYIWGNEKSLVSESWAEGRKK